MRTYVYIYTCIHVYIYTRTVCMYVCDVIWCDVMWQLLDGPAFPYGILSCWAFGGGHLRWSMSYTDSWVPESLNHPFSLSYWPVSGKTCWNVLDEWISWYWDPCFWEGLLWLGWLSPDSAEDYKENLERIKKGGKADNKADNQRHQSEQWPLDHHLSSNHHLCHTTWFIGNDELTNNANQYQAVYIKGCLSVLNMSWFSM